MMAQAETRRLEEDKEWSHVLGKAVRIGEQELAGQKNKRERMRKLWKYYANERES